MEIKKVDDKPMVIHTKQKAKLHTHEPKQAAIKGSNVYTVDRNPTKKKAENGKYRKSTVHQVQKEGMFSKYRKQMKQSGQSIKVKDSSLRNAGMVGGKVMTDQIEGGQEIQQYFCENAPQYHVACTGSLLGIALAKPSSFPVGKVNFMQIDPMTFAEFLLAITQFEVMPRYWSQNNLPYEVDFLIQRENDIFPVEVKSEANTTSKSMKKFKELFPDKVRLRIRFSLDNLNLDDGVLNIPLFMADQADRLIGLALEKRKQ